MKRALVLGSALIAAAGIVVVVRRKPAARVLTEAERRAEANAVVSRLPALEGYPFEVRYSPSSRAEAVRLANLARDGYTYFKGLFPESSPKLIATFLAPADWPRGYGEPSYY